MSQQPTISIGIHPSELCASVTGEAELKLDNLSPHPYSEIKLTVSYFNTENGYLDFEDIDIDPLVEASQRVVALELSPPDHTASATIDVTGQKQTFLKRHWKLISTIAALTWGFIIVARRLAP